jgi:phosphatidylserine/phosphatidylglycerophosphate/cardiolipin synthase-like enzyme
VDFATPKRSVALRVVSGRGHYDEVVQAAIGAHTSVWIATANLKELMIEDHRARPGVRRRLGRAQYRSVLAVFAELAARGVELRFLHAERPSRPFRAELAKHPELRQMEMRVCPRVHMKAVIVDGGLLYLGSANWTGAGLGARGSGRRNFELGVVTDDAPLLDQVQDVYDRVWRGAECGSCKLRALCPKPLDTFERRPAPPPKPAPKARKKPRKSRRLKRSPAAV